MTPPPTPREIYLLALLRQIHTNFKRTPRSGKYEAMANLDNYHTNLEAAVEKAVEG